MKSLIILLLLGLLVLSVFIIVNNYYSKEEIIKVTNIEQKNLGGLRYTDYSNGTYEIKTGKDAWSK